MIGQLSARRLATLLGGGAIRVIVEMDEGWHILSNVIGIEHDAVEVDLPVEVEFHPIQGGITLPYFRPTAANGNR